MNKACLMLIAGVSLIASRANAQLVDEFDVPPAACCLATAAKSLADQLQDWNQLGRYRLANQDLKKRPAES